MTFVHYNPTELFQIFDTKNKEKNSKIKNYDYPFDFEFKKGELIFIRDEQMSDRVSLSKSSSGEDWIVYTINEQSHVQNKYMLLSKDSLLVRQIDYGIESKTASLYLRK